MGLQTERSTDIRRDDPHIVFRNVEGPREYRLNHAGIGYRMNGQTSRTRIVVGQEGAAPNQRPYVVRTERLFQI